LAAYFLDSSAIVKVYVAEIGSGWVTSLLNPVGNDRVYVARITLVEVAAALHRRAKGGSLSVSDAIAAQQQLEIDAATVFRLIEMRPMVVSRAMELAAKHALRAYDAVQLAGANLVESRRLARGLSPLVFVSADRELNVAAKAEGLAVDDPLQHP
jgi:uncharacterized protein